MDMKDKGRNWIAVLAAVQQLLNDDASVVAVQGPPASGKSYLTIILADAMTRAGRRVQIVVADDDNRIGLYALLARHGRPRGQAGAADLPDIITVDDYWAQGPADRCLTDLVIFDDADTYEAPLPARRQAQAVWIGDLASTPPQTAIGGDHLTIQATRMLDSIATLMQRVDYPGHLVTGLTPRWRMTASSGDSPLQAVTDLGIAALYPDSDLPDHQELGVICAGIVGELIQSWSLVDGLDRTRRPVETADIAISCLSDQRGSASSHPAESQTGLVLTPSRLEDLADAPPRVLIVCCPTDSPGHLRRVLATCTVAAIVVAPRTTTMPLVRHVQHRTCRRG